MRSEESSAALYQVAVVYAQAAAHGARVFRIHVRADEVGEIRYAVLRRRLPKRCKRRVVPVEVAGDVVGGDGKGKYSSGSVAVAQYLHERAVEYVHLLLKFAVAFLLHLPAPDHRSGVQSLGDCHIESYVRKRR